MKEVTKERKSSYTVYEAVDGTEFYTKEECSIYEASAKGVIHSKIAKMIKGKGDAWETLGGYDDHKIVALKMNRPEDLDTVKQFFLLESPYYNNECNKELKEAKFNIMDTAYKENDALIFGVNSDGEYYFINSRANIIDNLLNLKEDKE
jgi:hypothetical protein